MPGPASWQAEVLQSQFNIFDFWEKRQISPDQSHHFDENSIIKKQNEKTTIIKLKPKSYWIDPYMFIDIPQCIIYS